MGIIHVLKRRKKHFRLNTEVAAKKKNKKVTQWEKQSQFQNLQHSFKMNERIV